ncbi:GTPase domain-containing protein [Asaia bogorensis]|uniref:GTPase n=1 Tax=Asaia bogorensis TaxID=91915 RepID=UPI000EFD602C|nr:GTPase domain-containing protein [Asaia bogorensis]
MSDLSELVPYGQQVVKILRDAGMLERAKDWLLRKTSQDVLVLGASGAGKSSFLKLISGENPQISRIERTTKSQTVTGKIEKSYFNLVDTPGQPLDIYRQERHRAILGAAGKRRLGIINVVSYGYHEETVKASEAVDNHRVKEAFLEGRRQLEVDLLSEWNEILCGEGGAADWMITVVTKADLWWVADADQPALHHYQSGPYFQALGSARRLSHDVRPYSSQNQLFYKQVPMSGFYSDEMRKTDHASLIAKMLENAAR